ncbi:MAG TPA: hypothetical protein ENH94_07185 [Phycisphaerales bacterium]|nr:hypothetical protein [Phycisphaerales bacterium]
MRFPDSTDIFYLNAQQTHFNPYNIKSYKNSPELSIINVGLAFVLQTGQIGNPNIAIHLQTEFPLNIRPITQGVQLFAKADFQYWKRVLEQLDLTFSRIVLYLSVPFVFSEALF